MINIFTSVSLFAALVAAGVVGCASTRTGASDPAVAMSAEVQALAPAAERIIRSVRAGNDAWAKLEHLALQIGPRLSGSDGLKRAVLWAAKTLAADGHDNVRAEPVMVPFWERGFEYLSMLAPAQRKMPLLGLGGTVATPTSGTTADVEVVRSLADVMALGPAARGKLLLIDTPMRGHDPVKGSGYGETVRYRYQGPTWADKSGAVGVLMRSLTATSLATPHTGGTSYVGTKRKVPAVAITTEDASAIARLRAAGVKVTLKLITSGQDRGWSPSANVVAELVGRERPHEIVVISGHLDAWDVGHGAHDDGSGCVMAMEALSVLRRLGLTPRRTIRVVLWTNEENGMRGARDYAFSHAEELPRHVAALEADSGSWRPLGYRLETKDDSAGAKTLDRVRQIVQLAAPIGAYRARLGYSGADVKTAFKDAGIPLLGHWMDTRKYFDIHHTHADTLDKVSPADLRDNVASMAVMAYALAELPGRIDGKPVPALVGSSRDLSELAWLAGDWEDSSGRVVWLSPRGGTMIGLGYQAPATPGADIRSYDRLRISRDSEGGLTLWHHPRGVGAAAPMVLKRVGGTATSVRFAGRVGDVSREVEYRRQGDRLTVTTSGRVSHTLSRRGDAAGASWVKPPQ